MPVYRTLTTVAAKRSAFTRQGARARAAVVTTSGGTEGISEGGCEPLESWGEPAIEYSQIGVHAE
jgi:hypothetical protein